MPFRDLTAEHQPYLAALGVALWTTAGADAHDSLSAYYFEDQTVTIEGTVVEFDYRAPARVGAPPCC